MQALANDWAFLRAAVDDLQDYLLSAQLFWRLIPGPGDQRGGELLQLTPGNLLLAQEQLAAYPWSETENRSLSQLLGQSRELCEHWKSHWRQKCKQETAVRLEQWARYIQEISSSTSKNWEGYPFQVRTRAILDLLRPHLDDSGSGLKERLDALDVRLKSLAKPGSFVWQAELGPGFPEHEYWYLYLNSKR